ncbi:C2 and GRAM domain-containing protein At5g50170-like isoform X2 [Actinidia eriantha]|uniref:C2 and GRAM domain-containing protein At5g50170-like isoform X2 n=1 Tax=Actinidia eriantha TaxID=165200 RepID=UPI0025846EA8|nr:C2 and GRAM domain-containing protein At5g50170-like isoform X2 [Actinidia eriantha]
MRLYVYVLEGTDLSTKDSYVKLQIGMFKSETRVSKGTKNPNWNEEFAFRVHDMEDELVVSVYSHEDGSGFFNVSGDLVGRVRVPVRSVSAEESHNLPPTWFSLERPKGSTSVKKECDAGKILLALSLRGRGQDKCTNHLCYEDSHSKTGDYKEREGPHVTSQDFLSCTAPSRKILEGKHIVKAIAGRLERLFNKNEDNSRNDDASEQSTTLSDYEDCMEETPSFCSFEKAMEKMESMSSEIKMPNNLQGGILLDQTYVIPSKDLNIFLFAPNSQFRTDLVDLQGSTNVQEGPWMWKSEDTPCLMRVVTYTKAATKLVKAVKATEEQTYTKADGREFAVHVNVSTPDVPYGNTFKIEILYRIMPGPQLSSGEESSHLVVSWGISFFQNTMMRGMIEGGARQGLKESFDQFASLLARNVKIVDSINLLDKNQMLATLQTEQQSDWELATEYFWNFTVVLAAFVTLYIFVHILLCRPGELQGLEFAGIDLPDSFGELIACGILVILLERVCYMVSHFVQARFQKGSDHGIKAQGDGWVLTVALIESMNLASLDPMVFPDPYVVFTCNGKTRTSSVKLQTLDPQWNEILEFDAAEEPPSVLDVEVFDFDGPFDHAATLGHSEINFLKHTSTELADIWVPLEGKLAQSSHSKLHLRIFLDNNNGVDTIKDYLTKMEKEVGKKLNLRSPHRNSAFQKIFGLPPEEFLISDFSCSLKRKMPLQGRLFLSARIVGFYANLFGHKTKFFFLWEDIDDIQVLPPSLASVGSPQLLVVLRKDRGIDARQGAKSQDEEGRLQFYFISFVSFNVASRTIMALWRTRTLTPDQKARIAEEQQEEDGKSICLEDTGSCLVVEDAKMSKVYSVELPMKMKSVMEMFDGGDLEYKVIGKSGCLSYVTTTWEPMKSNPDAFQRRLCYKFNRQFSIFGGEVACTQQKIPVSNGKGWIVNEVMALHDIPFSDHFRVHFKYQFENSVLVPNSCKCDVYVGVTWLKSTTFQQRITRNITEKFAHRLKDVFELVEREILLANDSN